MYSFISVFCHQVEIVGQGMRLRAEIEAMKKQLGPSLSGLRNRTTPHHKSSKRRSTDEHHHSPLKSVRCFREATLPYKTPRDHRTQNHDRMTPIELYPEFQPRTAKTGKLELPEKENLPSWDVFTATPLAESRVWPGISKKAVKSREYFDDLEVRKSPTKTLALRTESRNTSVWSASPDNKELRVDEQLLVKDVDQETCDLNEISCIFGGSFHEQVSTNNLNGAFHSTFSYPLHSTFIESSQGVLRSPDCHSSLQKPASHSYDSYTSSLADFETTSRDAGKTAEQNIWTGRGAQTTECGIIDQNTSLKIMRVKRQLKGLRESRFHPNLPRIGENRSSDPDILDPMQTSLDSASGGQLPCLRPPELEDCSDERLSDCDETKSSSYVKLMRRQVAHIQLTSAEELPLSFNTVSKNPSSWFESKQVDEHSHALSQHKTSVATKSTSITCNLFCNHSRETRLLDSSPLVQPVFGTTSDQTNPEVSELKEYQNFTPQETTEQFVIPFHERSTGCSCRNRLRKERPLRHETKQTQLRTTRRTRTCNCFHQPNGTENDNFLTARNPHVTLNRQHRNCCSSFMYASRDSRNRRTAIRKKIKQFTISMRSSTKRSKNIETLAHL